MKRIFALLLGLFLLNSCGEKTEKQRVAVGGPRYGGEFRFMSSEKIFDLLPANATDVYNQRVTNQIFETLLKIDTKDYSVQPLLAESFIVSPDQKEYTFTIRKGVFFHDDACFSGNQGREFTAEDVKFSLEFACSGLAENESSGLLISRIQGAKEFNAKTKKSLGNHHVSGIKVLNSQTVSIELVDVCVTFDKILTHSNLAIFPQEAYEKYGKKLGKHPVGTGPFKMKTWNNDKIELVRNDTYWRKDIHGNQLPFLDKIIMTYSSDKKAELLAFRAQQIDLVTELPVEEIDNVLGSLEEAQAGKNVKHRMDAVSSLSLTYFGFRHDAAPFSDVKVRKAFNIALNRDDLVEDWMHGEGYAMQNGFVPPMEGYDSEKVKGYKQNVAQAQALLAQAGYPNGKNFPTVTLYVNAKEGSVIHELAKGVQAQLKANLNVDIQILVCTIEEREAAIKAGKALMWSSGWVADYPDAENFLDLFYGKNTQSSVSAVSLMKYRSQQFDELFKASLKEKDPKKRNDLLVKCDQLIIDDAVVMPLMNDDFFTMIHSKFREFSSNSMEVLDFSTIFIKEPKK
jgi:peptide/nickel transport system substrate-binding protein